MTIDTTLTGKDVEKITGREYERNVQNITNRNVIRNEKNPQPQMMSPILKTLISIHPILEDIFISGKL